MRRSCATLLGFALMASPALADKTERVWQAKCASCHGDDGKGQTAKGKEMGVRDETTADWQKEVTDDRIQKAISDGAETTKDGKKQKMDGFKDKLSAEVIQGLVKYIRAFAK